MTRTVTSLSCQNNSCKTVPMSHSFTVVVQFLHLSSRDGLKWQDKFPKVSVHLVILFLFYIAVLWLVAAGLLHPLWNPS